MIDSWTMLWPAFAAAVVAACAMSGARRAPVGSRVAAAAAAFHPPLVVVLFYSLAIHMHRRLGAWPETLGDRGFPEGLSLHADLALGAFGALLLGCLLVLPVALLFCVFVPGLRSSMRYVGIYGCAAVVAVGFMQLAPAPFLDWWWD